MDKTVYAAAGALLVAVLNELRARSAARSARLERERFRGELKAETRQAVQAGPLDLSGEGE